MKSILTSFTILCCFSVYAELYTPGAYLLGEGDDIPGGSYGTLPSGNNIIGIQSAEGGQGAFIMTEIGTSIFDPLPFPVPALKKIGETLNNHSWHQTTLDTVIDASYVATSPHFSEIRLYENQSFLLAFTDEIDVYGWAELMWDGSELLLLDSAAENSGTGIIAGRHEVIPEPTTIGLMSISGLAFIFIRRKRFR